ITGGVSLFFAWRRNNPHRPRGSRPDCLLYAPGNPFVHTFQTVALPDSLRPGARIACALRSDPPGPPDPDLIAMEASREPDHGPIRTGGRLLPRPPEGPASPQPRGSRRRGSFGA